MPETKIERVVCSAFGMQNNSYLLYRDDRADCVIVDPAGFGSELIAALDACGKKPGAILLTHGHFDHIWGIPALEKAFGRIPVAIHEAETDALDDPTKNLSALFLGQGIRVGAAETALRDGQNIELAGVAIEVLHTPGHSVGSCCFAIGDALLTGDTLFRLGAGRSDTPGGDTRTLILSIARLFALSGDREVLPGHDKTSTLELERRRNTFMKSYAPQLLID